MKTYLHVHHCKKSYTGLYPCKMHDCICMQSMNNHVEVYITKKINKYLTISLQLYTYIQNYLCYMWVNA